MISVMTLGGYFSVDSLRGVHVLVVGDDALSRELVRSVLQYCGALVTAVGSAGEGLDVMRVIKPDVLVADLSLPDEDGYAFVRKVRALKPDDGGTVPVLAMSARADAATQVVARGFAGFVKKPLNPWTICRAISELISR